MWSISQLYINFFCLLTDWQMETNSDNSLVLPFPDIFGAVPFNFKRFKFFLKNVFNRLLAALKNREILVTNL